VGNFMAQNFSRHKFTNLFTLLTNRPFSKLVTLIRAVYYTIFIKIRYC